MSSKLRSYLSVSRESRVNFIQDTMVLERNGVAKSIHCPIEQNLLLKMLVLWRLPRLAKDIYLRCPDYAESRQQVLAGIDFLVSNGFVEPV